MKTITELILGGTIIGLFAHPMIQETTRRLLAIADAVAGATPF